MTDSKQPIYIMPENVSRTVGRDAQRNNILAAKIIADVVKSTLGPKGMDKMLVDSVGNITVTNDGVTILREMEVDHPVAKMIVDIAKTQESEVGDGTTTVAMLVGKLLENAEKLLDKRIHASVIVKGYKIAAEKANVILNEISLPVNNREILRRIARTSMTGRGSDGNKDMFAELIVKSVERIGEGREIDLNNIKIEKIKGESIEKSELIEGIVLDKEKTHSSMPSKISGAKILLINFGLEFKNPETETRISITTPEQLESFINAEEISLRNIAEKIIKSGANVVFCQKGIDDLAQYYLANAGVYACRRVAKSDIEKLSMATSAKIISSFNELTERDLGYAESVEEIKSGDEAMTYVKGCRNPRAVTLLIRGSTEHVVDEIERSFKDGLGVVASAVKEGKVVSGGGAVDIEVAKRLREFAKTIGGREQLAVEEFANAMEIVPETLAENAGLDQINILAELKQRHESGVFRDGINLFSNKIEDCFEAGILEPLKVKTQAITSAAEVANMILRIDDVLVSSGNSRDRNAVKEPELAD